MRINIYIWLVAIVSVVTLGCSSGTTEIEDELYGAGFIVVNEATWPENNTSPYPFTVPEGEISCSVHPVFGREVYFEPKGYTTEFYIGTPLNKSAVDSLKKARLTSNVPDSIKAGANLKDAIQIGLRVCDEQNDRFLDI